MAHTYRTRGGINVHCTVKDIPVEGAVEPLIDRIDRHRGALLTSSYEYPGRYTRWDIGFVDPPLCLESRARNFRFSALNDRGRFLLQVISRALSRLPAVVECEVSSDAIRGL